MVALIFCGDLKYCPYIKRYTERLEEKQVPYQVLFWNRGSFQLDMPENYRYFDSPSAEDLSKKEKLRDFFRFRKWLKKQFKTYKYDRIVALSTLTGILLFDFLLSRPHRYVFDIRDYSYEHIGLFRFLEKRLIRKSAFTAISSKGFQAFLPKHDYVIAHNFNRKEIVEETVFSRKADPIQFVWNGTMRYLPFQKGYIDALKNDDRFQIVYHGTGTELENFKAYCRENDVRNAVFTGVYDNKDKPKLLENAAILNNCYGDKNADSLRYAISNRYYDGLIFRIPQVVEPDGYKAGMTEEKGVGVAWNADADFADRLYAYYHSIDPETFNRSCREALEEVIREDDLYIARIDGFISEEEAN